MTMTNRVKTLAIAIVAAAESFGLPASDQDMELWGCYVTQHRWVSMYGDGARFQLERALKERSEQFVENPLQTISRSHGDVRNIPVLPPGHRKTSYRTWWAMRGCAPYRPGDIVPCATLDNGNFDELKRQYDSVHGVVSIVSPTCSAMCAQLDAQKKSYSIPPFGIVIFSNDALSEEHAHFFNWSSPGEPSSGFSNDAFNEISSWGEFKAAYRGLKVDAWRIGLDFGEPGAMGTYVAYVHGDAHRVTTNSCFSGFAYQTNIVEIAEGMGGGVVTNVTQVEVWSHEVVVHDDSLTFRQRVPFNSFTLLHAYLEARAAAGTGSDNADYERLRAWMTSASVGRKIL